MKVFGIKWNCRIGKKIYGKLLCSFFTISYRFAGIEIRETSSNRQNAKSGS
jgi:hypothetical protein